LIACSIMVFLSRVAFLMLTKCERSHPSICTLEETAYWIDVPQLIQRNRGSPKLITQPPSTYLLVSTGEVIIP
jgi:hypothetical protein